MSSFNPKTLDSKAPVQTKLNSTSLQDLLNKDIRYSNKIKNNDLEYVYDQMATLLSSGLDLYNALVLIIETTASKAYLNRILKEVEAYMIQGYAFSESLKLSKGFAEFDYSAIKIGEQSASLIEVFTDLRHYYKKKIATRRLFISSMTYPSIVLLFTAGVVVFLMAFLVPMFQTMFKQVGNELPWITQQVINLSEFIQTHLFTMFWGFGLMILALMYLSKQPAFLRRLHYLLIKIPVLNAFIKKANTLRYLQLMLLLNKAFVPLIDSLVLVQKSVTFYPLSDAFERLKSDLLSGDRLHESMARQPIFEKKLQALIRVGEEGNKLSLVYEKLIEQYEKDLEHMNKVLITFIQPLIILFLGAVVAIVLVAMYLPIFNLNTSVTL